MSRQKTIKVLSLFTGGGGLDIGFHQAAFEAVACVEIAVERRRAKDIAVQTE